MKLKNEKLLTGDAYINGKWYEGESRFAVNNPANGEEIAQVAACSPNDTTKAIDAAYEAFPEWAKMTGKERGKVLRKWHDLILDNQEDLAQILTAEQGKPLKESRGEIGYGASFVEWYAEEAKRTYGDIIPHTNEGQRIFVQKQPIGVCALITPWNFPNAMITRKAAPALAAGCTVVIKPGEDTPLSATALAVLAEEAGIPKGVFNVVPTNEAADIGKAMCEDDRVRKLSFTGSTEVGRILMKQCADTVKKVSFELGGNAPFIVFDDADIDEAVQGAIACKFRNAGQTCVCANRIYVQKGVYEIFADKFAEEVEKLKVGHGDEDGVDIGPLINEPAIEKVKDHIENAKKHGAGVMVGGKEHDLGGTFFEPTVLRDMDDEMKIATEETFGPVAPLFKFTDEEDVITQANDTIYGLASYFYAKDMSRVWRTAEALEYGMVAVNTPILSTEVAPFGGIKQSGIGREGSRYGIDEFMEMKYILLSGI
ncbi:MAG: NAD-dependent succinate-semialdehyde dehydrogenase [Alphaproteobacteria bacterium]|nr:NAD-dependent succinate-semialdehyde dehydrogenase [Alphaproteobacteria bacterium]